MPNFVLKGDKLRDMLQAQESLYAQSQAESARAYQMGHQAQSEMARQQQAQQSQAEQTAQGRQYSEDALARLLKKSPGGADISVGPTGAINYRQPDPFDINAKRTSLDDRIADTQRLETSALQNEYNKIVGKSRSKAEALKEIKTLLKNPTGVSTGQMQTALARAAGDVGALSEGDIARAMPSSLGGDLTKAWNYLTGGGDTPITQTQIKQIQDLIAAKEAVLGDQLGAGEQELRGRGHLLAPTLSKRGTLEDAYRSLGIGAKSAPETTSAPATTAIMIKPDGSKVQVPANKVEIFKQKKGYILAK